MREPELIAALWSLKEDADHAWAQAMAGDDRGLEALGRSMKHLESVVVQRDVRVVIRAT